MVKVEKIYESNLNELKKLSFDFYASLARGKEPLTYTYEDEYGNEHQVEVNASLEESGSKLDVYIGFDTDFKGRFDRTKGTQYSLEPTSDNLWNRID